MSKPTPPHIVEYEPLAPRTSWRIGGPARYYAEATTVDELRAVWQWARARDVPVLILGGGTNLLVQDGGVDGLVLRFRGQQWSITEQGRTHGLLTAEAGVPIGRLAWAVGAQGWGGLEWAAGLPGDLGGAIYGNAGCYGGDIASMLERGWLLVDNEREEWPAQRFDFRYRSSVLKRATQDAQGAQGVQDAQHAHQSGNCNGFVTRDHIQSGSHPVIIAAALHLERRDSTDVMQRMRQIVAERKAKTPVGHSCGSVFKNPPGGPPAGRLIEQAGLKGTRVGDAEISQHHANYIVNLGGASSNDVLCLIDRARTSVCHQSGIALELEIHIVGQQKEQETLPCSE